MYLLKYKKFFRGGYFYFFEFVFKSASGGPYNTLPLGDNVKIELGLRCERKLNFSLF